MGRLGSDSPARLRRMALATARTASSWPTTRLVEVLLHADELLASSASRSRVTGHTGPPAHHLGHVLGVDLLLQHGPARLQLGQGLGGLFDRPLDARGSGRSGSPRPG